MMHPALWLSMAALAFVVGYAVWLLVIARGAGIDPYDRLDALSDTWTSTELREWRPRKRRAG